MTQKKYRRIYENKNPFSKQHFALINDILSLFVEKREVSMNLKQAASAWNKANHKGKS